MKTWAARLLRLRVVVYLLLAFAGINGWVARHADQWRRHAPEFYRERLAYCRSQEWDAVIVGSSPAMCGIDADILAGARFQNQPLRRVCNAAMPLASASEIYHVVQHAMPTPPRLLIYGITITDLNGTRRVAQGPRYLMDARDVVRWIGERPQEMGWCLEKYSGERLLSLCPVLYHRKGIRGYLTQRAVACCPNVLASHAVTVQENLDNHAKLHTPRGLTESGPVQPSQRLPVRKAAGLPYQSAVFLERYDPQRLRNYLDHLVAAVQERGIPLVLVDMPLCADLEHNHPHEFATYRSILADLELRHRVVILRPTRADVGLTDQDFCDEAHFNADGTARFSAWLKKTIESR
ncbi:MAG: hypothetical protein ACK4RK_19730 [Gemmataceae bacterium]